MAHRQLGVSLEHREKSLNPDNKRTEIKCEKCGKKMVFAKQITPPVGGIGSLSYRCPTRDHEGGCGHIQEVLVNFTPYKQEIII